MENTQTYLSSLVLGLTDSKVFFARVAAMMLLIRGLVATMSPNYVAKKIGVKEKLSPTNEKIVRQTYMTMLNAGILAFCTVVNDYGLKAPVAINYAIWIAECTHSLFNNEPDTIGPSHFTEVGLCMAPSILFLFITLYMPAFFQKMIMIDGFYLMSFGMPTFFFPKLAMKCYEVKKEDSLSHLFTNTFGLGFTALGSYSVALAFLLPDDIDTTYSISFDDSITALGVFYATVSALYFTKMFVKRSYHENEHRKLLKLNWNFIYVDMAVWFIFTVLLLLPLVMK